VTTKPPPSRTRQSRAQLEAYIRSESLDSLNVAFTKHALRQMKARHITNACVLSTLQQGRIKRTPEPNTMKGTVECRMELFSAGHDVSVIVSLSDSDPALVIVTAFI
jgi:hypothetical protein